EQARARAAERGPRGGLRPQAVLAVPASPSQAARSTSTHSSPTTRSEPLVPPPRAARLAARSSVEPRSQRVDQAQEALETAVVRLELLDSPPRPTGQLLRVRHVAEHRRT